MHRLEKNPLPLPGIEPWSSSFQSDTKEQTKVYFEVLVINTELKFYFQVHSIIRPFLKTFVPISAKLIKNLLKLRLL
jgi:hypothetical protein